MGYWPLAELWGAWVMADREGTVTVLWRGKAGKIEECTRGPCRRWRALPSAALHVSEGLS